MKLESQKYNEYIPGIDIEGIKKGFELADTFTLGLVVKYIQTDTWELIKNLGEVLTEANSHEIGIVLQAIRARNESWIQAFSKQSGKDTYIDRAKGETKEVKKK